MDINAIMAARARRIESTRNARVERAPLPLPPVLAADAMPVIEARRALLARRPTIAPPVSRGKASDIDPYKFFGVPIADYVGPVHAKRRS